MEHGYIKRTITFIIASNIGDRFLNKNECTFITGKSMDGESSREVMVVDEKVAEGDDAVK